MTVSDLIVSPCKIYYAATGTTLPDESVAYGGSWPAGWTALAETASPLSIDYNYDKLDYDIQESLAAVGRKKTKEALKVETTIAAITLTHLSLAWGGTVSTVAAAAGQHGYEYVKGGDITTLTQRAWGFEGQTEGGQPIRIIIYKATAVVGGKLEFGKASQTGIPLQIEAIADMTKSAGERLYYVERVTAEPTS